MGEIQANLILELLGRPPEHLKEAMTSLVLRLGSEKGIEIKNKVIHDPKPAQNSKTLYTTFAEVEVSFNTIDNYLAIIFAYLPSHIEVIYPEKFPLSNSDLNDLGNTVLSKIHHYDSVVKNVLAERENLIRLMASDAPKLYKKLLSNLPKEQQEKFKQITESLEKKKSKKVTKTKKKTKKSKSKK